MLSVRYPRVSLSPTLGMNEKVEQHIRKKTHKPNALRFWVEGDAFPYIGRLLSHSCEISPVFPPRILPTSGIRADGLRLGRVQLDLVSKVFLTEFLGRCHSLMWFDSFLILVRFPPQILPTLRNLMPLREHYKFGITIFYLNKFVIHSDNGSLKYLRG